MVLSAVCVCVCVGWLVLNARVVFVVFGWLFWWCGVSVVSVWCGFVLFGVGWLCVVLFDCFLAFVWSLCGVCVLFVFCMWSCVG